MTDVRRRTAPRMALRAARAKRSSPLMPRQRQFMTARAVNSCATAQFTTAQAVNSCRRQTANVFASRASKGFLANSLAQCVAHKTAHERARQLQITARSSPKSERNKTRRAGQRRRSISTSRQTREETRSSATPRAARRRGGAKRKRGDFASEPQGGCLCFLK